MSEPTDAPTPKPPDVDMSNEPAFTVTPRGVRRQNMQALQRRKQAALLVAQGKLGDKEIAAMLGVQAHSIHRWKAEPRFQCMVEEFSARIVDGAIQSVQERLNADAPTNITFLKQVRDGNWQDDHKRMAIRVRASEALFDRQAPKGSNVENAVKVVIGGNLLNQMIRAVKHDGGTIDAEFEAAVDQLPAPEAKPDGDAS